jgi:sec-independent protein translocase protein TatA
MGIGIPELLLILVVVLIVFGAGKLPGVMKDLGKGVKSFREGVDGAATKSEGKDQE